MTLSRAENLVSVSVVIVCHNDGNWLPRCLESIRAQTAFDRLEVIIADNDSSDGTGKLAQELIAGWPNARFLPTGGDYGFGIACNLAAEAARGTYLFLLNPDTWLEADCVETLHRALEQSGAGAAGSLVLDYQDNSIQTQGGTGFDFCGNAIANFETPPRFLLCPGSFFFIRNDLFQRVGRMDTKWFLYGEEMDLSWRIWISGNQVMSVGDARIHHQGAVNVNPGGGGTSPAPQNRTSLQKRFLANRNRLLFIAKNCQHFLLLMLFPCALLVLLEGAATWIMTRQWSLARATSLDAFGGVWKLRGHIISERRRIASFRRHGDFWMLRFFRFGFGRWNEISKILRSGFPSFR